MCATLYVEQYLSRPHPSNLALCVNSNFVYVKVKSKSNRKIYLVAESLLSKLPTETPIERTPNGSTVGKANNATYAYDVLEKRNFQDLHLYEPVFEYFTDAFRVVADDYVTATSRTGTMHLAPQFGEDDLRVAKSLLLFMFFFVLDSAGKIEACESDHYCPRSDTPLIHRAIAQLVRILLVQLIYMEDSEFLWANVDYEIRDRIILCLAEAK
ncbi:isoleucine--tRNA ligase, cytoplasmic [Tanacetum coccineum]